MALYGLRLRPATPASHQVLQAPIQKLLPEEMMLTILGKLPAAHLAMAQCVCLQWRTLADSPDLWRAACSEAFRGNSDPQTDARLVRTQHRGSWKAMFLDRPHLRFDGLYVSRNTYLRTGIVEWRVKNPVHMVCYFRYYRFYPDGHLLYRTSPEVVSKVARTMTDAPRKLKHDDALTWGRYRLEGLKLSTAMIYPNSASTEIRSRLKLRSTVRGANNRLDVDSIVSYDRCDGSSVPVDAHGDDDDVEDTSRLRSHSRGKSPFVFIPWEHVADSPLNHPVSKMDFYVPG
ncbi:hypothetical protein WJX84_005129 [Apatococcus fuscideae]|uniref:F-box domain-containing protein n=1 Tax=Apatococcus fuscideae TaxID=2026836 RepID=A0AAW1RR00_9CHLO